MSISEWRQVQELIGRMAEHEKAFAALQGLHNALEVRCIELEVRLDDLSKPTSPYANQKSAQQQVRR